MPKLIDYLESARADNTGTSQMDRLLAENEISNMHTDGSLWNNETYDIAKEWVEGMMPIGARLSRARLIKKLKGERKFDINKARNALRYIKDSNKFFKKGKEPDTRGGWCLVRSRKYKSGIHYKDDHIDVELDHPDWGLIDKYKTGGPVQFETAAQDETAHTNMDRLIAEYGQSQQPQYSMREYQEPYDPAREIAEGAFMPVAGLTRKGYLAMVEGGTDPIGKQAAHFRSILDDALSQKIIKGQNESSKFLPPRKLSKEAIDAQYIKHLLKHYGSR